MRMLVLTGLSCCLLLTVAAPSVAAGISAEEAFASLSTLAGTWKGTPVGEGPEAEASAEVAGEAVHEIQVSAAGTVIMETMNPGTDHEMINMYHRDGDDLLLTHYCAGGNQPRMRLDREHSSAERLVFDYDGGTNHDPAVDPHIHSAEILLIDDDRMDSNWSSRAGGEPAGRMMFKLSRAE